MKQFFVNGAVSFTVWAIAHAVRILRDNRNRNRQNERLQADLEKAFEMDPYFAENYQGHLSELDTFLNLYNIPKHQNNESSN